MTQWNFDAVARQTANFLDRRSLLGLLGSVAAAGTLSPIFTLAADKKKDKKTQKMCKKDYGQCTSSSRTYCDQYYDPPFSDQCKSDTQQCCNFLKKCTRKSYAKANSCVDLISW